MTNYGILVNCSSLHLVNWGNSVHWAAVNIDKLWILSQTKQLHSTVWAFHIMEISFTYRVKTMPTLDNVVHREDMRHAMPYMETVVHWAAACEPIIKWQTFDTAESIAAMKIVMIWAAKSRSAVSRVCKPFKEPRNWFLAWRNRFLWIDSWAP